MRAPIPPQPARGSRAWKILAALAVFSVAITAYLLARRPAAEDADAREPSDHAETSRVYHNRAVWTSPRRGAPEAAHIRGTVYDQQGRPIAGARVTASTYQLAGNRSTPIATVETKGDGRFELNVPDGSYYLTCEREGYGPAMAAAQTDDDIGLVLPKSGVVKGHVRDEHGMPVTRFALDVLSPSTDDMAAPSPFSSRRVESVDGSYTLSELPDRSVYLRVTAAGKAPAISELVRVDPGDSKDVDFSLTSGCAMTGVVKDAQGAPVPDVLVSAELRKSAGAMGTWSIDATSTDRSDDEGKFVLENVPIGDVVVRGYDGDHAVSTATAKIEKCEGVPPVELRMVAGSGIEGVVRDATGKSVPGARITLSQRAIGFVNTTADEHGRYRFERLPAGGMRLEAMRGDQHTTALVTVPEGEIAQKDMVFSTGAAGSIQGRITAGDRPLPGMAVTALTNEGGMLGSRHGVTERDGTFQMTGLKDGVYAVLIESMSRVQSVEVKDGSVASIDIDIAKPQERHAKPEMPAQEEQQEQAPH